MDFADAPKLPKKISTLEAAIRFLAHLYLVDGIAFHPDTSFIKNGKVQYVDHQNLPVYTPAQAKKREALRMQFWRVSDEPYSLSTWVAAWFKFYPEEALYGVPGDVLEILERGFPRKQDWSPRKPE